MNHSPHPRARVSCRCSLSSRESDFSPTNQPKYSFMRFFVRSSCGGKKEHNTIPRYTINNNNNNALNLFSFSHHPKPRFRRRRREGERRKLSRVVIDRSPGKAWVFRAFYHRSFVEKKKKKRCILLRKARKEARIRRRKYTTCTRTFCTKTRRRL